MGINYTETQKKAIYKDGCNLLVAAAAGSGKTAVLTERIIQKIINKENPIDITSLLIVTFTEAATSEMRQRISKRLETELFLAEKENSDMAYHISKQLSLLNKAQISTIDSFCLNVVRKNFNFLDIDPNFRIADKSEIEIIKDEILENLFEELYEKNSPDFIEFIKFFSKNYIKNSDTQVKLIVNQTYDIMQSMPNPREWLEESVNEYDFSNGKTIFETKWAKVLIENLLFLIDKIKNDAKSAVLLLKSSDSGEKFITFFLDFCSYLDNCCESLKKLGNIDCSALKNGFEYTIQLRSSKANPINPEIKDILSALNKEIKDDIKKFYSYLDFFSPKSESFLRKMYPVMQVLEYVVNEFSERLFNFKKEKLIFEFNDISHLALKILSDKNLKTAREYQEKFVEIIMDEYQDTNEIQETILNLISGENLGVPNRFMVGDVKQCIYGFRLANPNLFSQKYDLYKENKNGCKIDLYDNFRSRECVLSAINFIFRQIMTKESCNIEYDENAMLHFGAKFKVCLDKNVKISNDVDFTVINSDKNDEEFLDEEIKDMVNAELELVVIADKIENMINKEKLQIYDKDEGGYRAVEYRDIAILARSTKDLSQPLQNVFVKRQIPFSTEVKSGYFDCIEVSTILAFLSVIDNPYQDIELITVLHSPAYSFSFDELTKIKIVCPDKSFYSAMLAYVSQSSENVEAEIVNKLNLFFYDFEKWSETARNLTINELLQEIYDDTNYYNYVGIFPNGELRRLNLKALQEKAIEFEKINTKGLFRFLQYINKLKKLSSQNDMNISSENENFVRIVNVHQSKGLEYPVVFVCRLGKNFMKPKESFFVDQALGIGSKYNDTENKVIFDTLSKQALAFKQNKDSVAEEIRILYVALTRAREKLSFVCSISKFEETMRKYTKIMNFEKEQIPAFWTVYSENFAQMLISALSRHSTGSVFRAFSKEEPKINQNLFEDGSKWNISVVNRSDLSIAMQENENEQKQLYIELKKMQQGENDIALQEEINRRLLWEYPNCKIQNVPLTTSISEIKRKAYDEEEYIPRTLPSPNFVKEVVGLSASQRGTAVHTLLEHIDFNLEYDEEFLKEYLKKLSEKNILSEIEARSIDISKMLIFLNSDIKKRIQNSDYVFQETPFVMGIEPYELFKEDEYKNMKDDILVHGIIDLYFEENDGIVLLDYKTDFVDNVNEIMKKYKIQIELYKRAIENATGKKVLEYGLYLFGVGKYFKY